MKEDSITCPLCGRTSYNRNYIDKIYCGSCHQFHPPAVWVVYENPSDFPQCFVLRRQFIYGDGTVRAEAKPIAIERTLLRIRRHIIPRFTAHDATPRG